MRQSIKVKPKKRGRPATGKDPMVGTRIPVEMIGSIDKWATENGVSRSEAVRRLIQLGLSKRR